MTKFFLNSKFHFFPKYIVDLCFFMNVCMLVGTMPVSLSLKLPGQPEHPIKPQQCFFNCILRGTSIWLVETINRRTNRCPSSKKFVFWCDSIIKLRTDRFKMFPQPSLFVLFFCLSFCRLVSPDEIIFPDMDFNDGHH